MILSGWKEIAGYLHCGVRTVQRWEAEGLPVHRPTPGRRSHVISDSVDLDRWVRRRAALPENQRVLSTIKHSEKLQKETRARVLQLREHVLRLQAGVRDLQVWRQRQLLTRVTRLSANRNVELTSSYPN